MNEQKHTGETHEDFQTDAQLYIRLQDNKLIEMEKYYQEMQHHSYEQHIRESLTFNRET